MEHRDEETYNPKIPSGTIELEAHKIDVLGRVYKQLPFEIQTSKEIREDVRLKYRYLDLRNAKVKDNIVFRSKVISYLRQKMTDMGFLEIQTPILCASSPEGARDYIVPSRKFKGKFYALPQAPQQYKQLLMASGFDKYFQIAPCFRDEDARADRSPGAVSYTHLRLWLWQDHDLTHYCRVGAARCRAGDPGRTGHYEP